MITTTDNTVASAGIYRVRDPFRLLKTVILFIITAGIAGVMDYAIYPSVISGKIPWGKIFTAEYAWKSGLVIAANVLAIGVLLRLKALWAGVKVDLDDRTLEFPGGSVAANDFSDYFKPSFLLQYFLRKTVAIDQIRQLGQRVKRSVRTVNGNVKVTQYYAIAINGSFGAAEVWFDSEGKCDEIYSAIRQLNNMGEPIVRA